MGRMKMMMMVCVLVSPCLVECRGERVMLSILLGTMTGSASALVCACLLTLFFRYLTRLPLLNGPVVFSPRISPKSLQSAVAAQTPLLLDNNNNATLSLNKLHPRSQTHTSRRRIQRDLHILAALRHSHLITLLAYYYYVADNDSFFYLVYDHLPTAITLEDAINNINSIGWDARLRIAVGIIKGLEYLHFGSTPPLLHCDLKPSNVLLDADFEPRLGGCGLANTFDGVRSPQDYFYYAPECFPDFSIYTEKSDIFSFGVILGMLLTGRDPRDRVFGEAGGMGMWFRQVVEAGDGREALDKSLLGEETQEDEMVMAVRIAAVCLSDMPLDRPSSDELVPMLTQLHSF